MTARETAQRAAAVKRAAAARAEAQDRARMVRAILRHYDAATAAEAAAGEAWYSQAAGAAHSIAAQHGITFEMAAGAIAALSPRQTWSVNVRNADLLAAAWCAGASRPPAVGLGASLRSAWRVLGAPADPLAQLRGDKVRAFAANITGDRDAVTVDVWAARAAGLPERAIASGLRGAAYARVAAAYRRAALLRGVAPRTMQATVWCRIRGAAD